VKEYQSLYLENSPQPTLVSVPDLVCRVKAVCPGLGWSLRAPLMGSCVLRRGLVGAARREGSDSNGEPVVANARARDPPHDQRCSHSPHFP